MAVGVKVLVEIIVGDAVFVGVFVFVGVGEVRAIEGAKFTVSVDAWVEMKSGEDFS